MDYAHVTAGSIDIGPGPLPRQWQDGDILRTGLAVWPAAELLAMNWRPVTGAPPVFDPITQILSAPSFTVGPSEITASWTVIDLDAAEVEINQDGETARTIAGRLSGGELFAITTLMEATKAIYFKLRAIDPAWDLTAETKRKAQKLFDATNPP